MWKALSTNLQKDYQDLDEFMARASKANVRRSVDVNVPHCLESFAVTHPVKEDLKLFAAQVKLCAGICASRNRANRTKIETNFGISPTEAAAGTSATALPAYVRAAYALYFDAAGIDVSPYFPVPLIRYVRTWGDRGMEKKVSDRSMMDILVSSCGGSKALQRGC